MQISELLQQPLLQVKTPNSERASIIQMFVDEINAEREGTKWKPVTGRSVAIQLSCLKTNFELYNWLSQCRDYKNRHGSFGKIYYGALDLKKKKHETK